LDLAGGPGPGAWSIDAESIVGQYKQARRGLLM
jgi:hypothetical protein